MSPCRMSSGAWSAFSRCMNSSSSRCGLITLRMSAHIFRKIKPVEPSDSPESPAQMTIGDAEFLVTFRAPFPGKPSRIKRSLNCWRSASKADSGASIVLAAFRSASGLLISMERQLSRASGTPMPHAART